MTEAERDIRQCKEAIKVDMRQLISSHNAEGDPISRIADFEISIWPPGEGAPEEQIAVGLILDLAEGEDAVALFNQIVATGFLPSLGDGSYSVIYENATGEIRADRPDKINPLKFLLLSVHQALLRLGRRDKSSTD